MDFCLMIVLVFVTTIAQAQSGTLSQQTSSASPVDDEHSEYTGVEFLEKTEYPLECRARMSNTTQYPHFVSVTNRRGYLDVDLIPDPNEFFYGYSTYGVIVSNNYVLWSGPVCYDCTYIVAVGLDKKQTGGTRHKAVPIPDDKIWGEHSHLNHHGYLVLLRLYEPIIYSARAQPVRLPEPGQNVKSGDLGLLIYELEDHEMIDQFNRTILTSQDCNNRLRNLRSAWPHLTMGELPEEAEVSEGFICVVDPPMDGVGIPCFYGPTPALFVEGHLAGIEHGTITVPSGPQETVSFQVHHDIAYVRNFIKYRADV